MKTKLVTAPTVEPVTLAELKAHLRIESSGSFADDVTVNQCITPGDHVVAASYSLVGTGVDVLGKQALVVLNSGTNGTNGTVDAKIQESDDDDTYTDVTSGAFTQVTTANDNAVQEKAYTGTKEYIRVVVTVGTATCDFGIDVITGTSETAEDDWLTKSIVTARRWLEKYAGRAFVNQTWEAALDQFPASDRIVLPYPPLSSVTSIDYYDTDETEAEFDDGYYIVDSHREPGQIVLGYGQVWPTTTLRPVNGVIITYVAGYGAAASYVPQETKTAIMMLAGHYYENREAATSSFMIPRDVLYGIDELMGIDRVPRV